MSIAAEQRGGFLAADIEAERRTLGILVKHPETADTVLDRLKPDHFTDPVYKRIFQIILQLYSEKGRISYTQVYNLLRKDLASAEQVLIGIMDSFVSPVELGPSVDSLADKQGRRVILEAAQAIQNLIVTDAEVDLQSCQSKAQEIIFAATQKGAEGDIKNLMEVLNKCYLHLVERREGKKPYGLPVRFPEIDMLTTGFKNKDLIILAARPSMGKTALVLNFAVNVAKRGVPALIFSLEMDDVQIGDRLVLTELYDQKLPDNSYAVPSADYSMKLSDNQFETVQSVFNDLYNLPIFISDRRGLTVSDMRAKARKMKTEHPKLGLIIIDYLQLIKPPAASNKNWALVVGDMVREIRDLAGELDLPIILCSQLNRGVETRENKKPVMSDLRDSGNIEEFADVVSFLYREDYYYPDKAKENGTEGQVEVIFAKQRKGPTGSANLRFIREYTRFVEVTDRYA
ncbi:MAG: DnaB-like helicase C-terminal domain-containing protein [Kiritimatiellia bacterium]